MLNVTLDSSSQLRHPAFGCDAFVVTTDPGVLCLVEVAKKNFFGVDPLPWSPVINQFTQLSILVKVATCRLRNR